MSQLNVIRKNVPVKGMNTVAPKRNFSDEFSPSILNCWYDDGVTLRRRLCTSKTNTAVLSSPAQTMFEYSDVTSQLFVQDGLGAISLVGVNLITPQSFTATVTTTLPIDPAYVGVLPPIATVVVVGAITTTTTLATTTAVGSIVVVTISAILFTSKIRTMKLGKMLIVGDGISPALKYDGAAFSNIKTPPSISSGNPLIGNIFHVHLGRMYAAGDPAHPMTINISDTVTASGVDYWASPPASATGEQGGFLDISRDIGAGDKIVGISTHRGLLVVFCVSHILFYISTENKVAVTGTPVGISLSLYKVIGGEGLVSQDSIQQIGGDIIFLSLNGFKKISVSLIQGDSQVNDLSSPINNVVKAKMRLATFNPLLISSTYNAKFGLYMCSFGDGEVWVMQPAFDGWFKWNGLAGRVFTDSKQVTHYAAATIGILTNTVFQDGAALLTSSVNMSWEIAPFKAGLDLKMRWNKFSLSFESTVNSNVTISVMPDMQTLSAKLSIMPVTIASPVSQGGLSEGTIRVPLSARAEILSISVSNNANVDFRFKVAEAYFNAGGLRK